MPGCLELLVGTPVLFSLLQTKWTRLTKFYSLNHGNAADMPGEDSPLREVETVTGDWGGGDEHLTAGRKH